jgi:hypothetical protein
MSFPAWLWVILGAVALVAGSVTFKMVQGYTTQSSTPPPPAAVAPGAVAPPASPLVGDSHPRGSK